VANVTSSNSVLVGATQTNVISDAGTKLSGVGITNNSITASGTGTFTNGITTILGGITNLSSQPIVSTAASVIATNFFISVQTNYLGTAAVSPITNIPPTVTPLGVFGMMGQVTSNYCTLQTSVSVYTNVFGSLPADRMILNGFTGNLTTGTLTNTYAGYYRFWVSVAVIPEVDNNNDEFEIELFNSGVGNEFYSTFLTAATGVRNRFNMNGIVYLPAGTWSDIRIKNLSDTSSAIPITRINWGFGTP
jgi:hypothetical protein